MFKKFLALGLLIIGSSATASEFLIKVTPAEKITTADDKIQEGDEVQFQVVSSTSPKIKKGEKVSGYITYYENNGFGGREATISIEQFRSASGTELNGTVFAKGNQHNQLMEFNETTLIPPLWTRGGEVTLFPEKDVFLLYLEK